MRQLSDVLGDVRAATDVYEDRHFVYTSGDHGHAYANYRKLGLQVHRRLLQETAIHLMLKVVEVAGLDPTKPITIVGPETLGEKMLDQIFCAPPDELPLTINTRAFHKVPSIHEKTFVWAAHPASLIGHDVQTVWMDDLLNKSSTFQATDKLVHQHDGKIDVVAVIGDRSGLLPEQLGVQHIVSLEQFQFDRLSPEDCKYCAEGRPIVRRPGHGWEFEKANPGYPGGFIDL